MRSPARKRPVPRNRVYGEYLGQGPQAEDAISGWWYPKKDMIRQDGFLVYREYREGSRDKPEDY